MKRMILIGLVLILAIVTGSAAVSEPLTYGNIVAHFKAAQLRAIQVQKRCTVFFEGEWASQNVYSYAMIVSKTQMKTSKSPFISPTLTK